MASDRRTFDRLRAQARQARADGYFAQAARLERQAVELAGTLGSVGERTQALLWEGYSLRQAGEDDLALTSLLQAANERAATADPADVFGALVAIIHIGLERKTAAFCRALLAQGRRYLADIRQPWTALLDFLEGELNYCRGDFAAAWDRHSRAWSNRRDEPPRLTAATHIWALCRTAFRRRDLTELERLVERLNELHPTPFLERQLLQRAQLLRWRARRAVDSNHPTSKANFALPAELALALLGETAVVENRDTGACDEALRALALAERWDEVDAALSRQPLQIDRFEPALLLGDLTLIRTRATLGLPALDADYGESTTDISAPFSALAAVALRQAEDHYRAAWHLAEVEDERLETSWYSDVLRNRFNVLHGVA